MSARIKYTHELMGEPRVIKDFDPHRPNWRSATRT